MNDKEFNSELDKNIEIKNYVVNDHTNELIKNKINLDTINIIHLNIRSIKKNFDNLMVLLESLIATFEIIVLSETWNITSTEHFNIQGYNIYYSGGNHNQNDGVIIYVKQQYLPNFTTIKFTENTFTNLLIEINNVTFNITAVYRLPSTITDTFLLELEQLLKNNKNKNTIDIFVGDINIDIIKKQDNITNEYLNIVVENGYHPYITNPQIL